MLNHNSRLLNIFQHLLDFHPLDYQEYLIVQIFQMLSATYTYASALDNLLTQNQPKSYTAQR